MNSNINQLAAMLGVSVSFFKEALKKYRMDVPTVGTVTEDEAQQFLHDGRICRGWMDTADGRMYFHVIKSPEDFPQKSLFSGKSEAELFAMTVTLGMEHKIELEDLVT